MRATTRRLAGQLIRLTLLFLLCAQGIIATRIVRAQSLTLPVRAPTDLLSLKLSPDLLDLAVSALAGTRVHVIVQSAGPWGYTLDTLLLLNGARITRAYQNLDMRAVDLPALNVLNLAVAPGIKFISPDRETRQFGHLSLTTGADAARSQSTSASLDGAGVGIAVLDSGVYASHKSFLDGRGKTRVVVSKDFTGENRTDDPYGHGTHVASIAAGGGSVSQGAYLGLAPGARLLNLRVLNKDGEGRVSGLLGALDWVLTNRAAHNIRVVSMSLGAAAVDSYEDDPACRAVRRLVDAGVVVVAAAGNNGKDGSGTKLYGHIHSPGNEPSAITVGASNSFGTDARSDDTVATYSSRGPTRSYRTDSGGVRHYDNLIKPDLVAPGNKLIGAEAVGNLLVTQNPHLDAGVSPAEQKKMMYLSGTSTATPAAAGAAALLLQANPGLTPNLVKAILMYTAQPLAGFNHFEQGAGLLNLEGAVRLARLVRADLTNSTPVGSPLLSGPAPAPWSTLAGHTFGWSQGLIMDQTFASGLNLITKYQSVYGTGVLLTDGTFEADGVLLTDGILMSDGVLLSDSILTGSGVTIDEGIVFMDAGVLLGGGVLLTDGRVFGDGVLVSDWMLVSDGVLMGDRVEGANSALVGGEDTACMPPVPDY